MKFFVQIFFLISFSTIAFSQNTVYQWYDKNGNKISIYDSIPALENADFVFFGELHTDSIAHWWELELTQQLYKKHKQNLILGAEMFETDNQMIVDEFLAGYFDNGIFEKECRLWNNYKKDYKPLMTFARENKLKFIATNTPNRYAKMVFRNGIESLDGLSATAKTFLPPLPIPIDINVNCYKKMMDMDLDHVNENLPKAQAVKDATMSYFILQNYKKGNHFLHFNGSYHSDNKEGIIYYLSKKVDKKSIKSISCVQQTNVGKLEENNQQIADFILCIYNEKAEK